LWPFPHCNFILSLLKRIYVMIGFMTLFAAAKSFTLANMVEIFASTSP